MDPRKFGSDVSVYDRTPNARTDSESRGKKKLYRVAKGIPDVYLAFSFGAKLTILVATNGVARVKNLD